MNFFFQEKEAERQQEEAAYAAAGELRNFVLEIPRDRGEIQAIHVEGFSMYILHILKTFFCLNSIK